MALNTDCNAATPDPDGAAALCCCRATGPPNLDAPIVALPGESLADLAALTDGDLLDLLASDFPTFGSLLLMQQENETPPTITPPPTITATPTTAHASPPTASSPSPSPSSASPSDTTDTSDTTDSSSPQPPQPPHDDLGTLLEAAALLDVALAPFTAVEVTLLEEDLYRRLMKKVALSPESRILMDWFYTRVDARRLPLSVYFAKGDAPLLLLRTTFEEEGFTAAMREFVERVRSTILESERKARGRGRESHEAKRLHDAFAAGFAALDMAHVLRTLTELETATKGVRAAFARLDTECFATLAAQVRGCM